MAEKTTSKSSLIIVIVLSTLVLAGSSVGIWLGVREQSHPEPEWSFKISGNIVGDDFNITMSELLEMTSYRDTYTIRSKTNDTDKYTGVQFSYLFDEIIAIDPSAENVTIIAWDGYAWKFSIDFLKGNDTHILAYKMNNQFLDSYLVEDGIGYLYSIVTCTEDYPFNGQRSIKSVVEINFE
ncbi:MAG: molybdopterin-dependent oxidoreductase [Candidatus Heimdallarchaeota archaeon]